MNNKKALIISDFDSRISWCSGFAARLKYLNFHNTFVAMNDEDNLSERSISKNIHEFNYIKSFRDLKYLFSEEYSLVVLMVGGGMYLKVCEIFRTYYEDKLVRPIIISGFNGIEDTSDPQGILIRSVSDYICINSATFMEYSNSLFRRYSLDSKLVRTGFIRDYWDIESHKKSLNIDKIMLVLQPGILDHPKQLKYLGDKIKKYHEYHPDREIVIKARGRKNVSHVNSHVEKDFYMDFWHELASNLGPKVNISYDEIEIILNKVDAVVSFTSAVFIEAIILNKRVAALSDYGISKNIGNLFLMNSEFLVSFDNILRDEFPDVDSKWKLDWCFYEHRQLDELIKKVYREYKLQSTKGKLPFVNGFYNELDHPYLFLFKNESVDKNLVSTSIFSNFRKKIECFKPIKWRQ